MNRKFGDKLGLLDLTEGEIKRLGDCMKDDRFMDLLRDYTIAISSPENKDRYEKEITEVERQRGMDVKFILPTPGHVLKTSVDGEQKCFINICSSEEVEKPQSKPSVQGSTRGMQWSIPHSLSKSREDKDKAGNKCTVFDVVYHPDTYHMAQKNVRFRKMVHDMALDAVERLFKVKLDKVNVKTPKMKFKGVPSSSIVRTPKAVTGELNTKEETDPNDPLKFPVPPIDERFVNGAEAKPKEPEPKSEPKSEDEEEEDEDEDVMEDEETEKDRKFRLNLMTDYEWRMRRRIMVRPTNDVRSDLLTMMEKVDGKKEEYVEPKYTLTHRGYFDMKEYYKIHDHSVLSTRPRELILNVELPLLKAASAVHLEIFEDRVLLECVKPVRYKLHLKLPYAVDDSKGHAKFDKSKRRLTITLEVLPPVGQHPYSALMVLANDKEDACSSCVRETMEKLSGRKETNEEPKEKEDPSENVFMPSTHPSGLVHGRMTCRHVQHGELWGANYDENWKNDFNLGHLTNPSPTLLEMLADLGRERNWYGEKTKERPPIQYHQDNAFVTIMVNVKSIGRNTLWYLLDYNSLQFCAMSEASGERWESKIFQIYIKFQHTDWIDPRRSRVDVSDGNAVFLLRKHITSWHEWQTFQAGFDQNHCETRSFATEANVNKLLSTVQSESKSNAIQEFECEVVSEKENTELLALKLIPKEIKDDESIEINEDVDKYIQVHDLPGLQQKVQVVRKEQDENGFNPNDDCDEIMRKKQKATGKEDPIYNDPETDEYETADSSSEEDRAREEKRKQKEAASKLNQDAASPPQASGAPQNVQQIPKEGEDKKNSPDPEVKSEEQAEKDRKMKEIIAKINANTLRNLEMAEEDAAAKGEKIVYSEVMQGPNAFAELMKKNKKKKKEKVSQHHTKSGISLQNKMLFDIDSD